MQEPAQPTTNGQSPWEAQASAEVPAERPEMLVGAAFLGGIVLAQVLKRLGDDD